MKNRLGLLKSKAQEILDDLKSCLKNIPRLSNMDVDPHSLQRTLREWPFLRMGEPEIVVSDLREFFGIIVHCEETFSAKLYFKNLTYWNSTL